MSTVILKSFYIGEAIYIITQIQYVRFRRNSFENFLRSKKVVLIRVIVPQFHLQLLPRGFMDHELHTDNGEVNVESQCEHQIPFSREFIGKGGSRLHTEQGHKVMHVEMQMCGKKGSTSILICPTTKSSLQRSIKESLLF